MPVEKRPLGMGRGPGPDHKYRLAYKLACFRDGVAGDQVGNLGGPGSDHGFADALLVVSLTFPKHGGLSVVMHSVDGRAEGAPLSDEGLFQCFVALARRLGLSRQINEAQREMCWAVWEAVSTAITGRPQTREEAEAVTIHNVAALQRQRAGIDAPD